MYAVNVNKILDEELGGTFQVYSITTNRALSEPKPFSAAYDDLERVGYGGTGGAPNGIDIRRVTTKTGELV